jgi:hypothetical protein
MHMGLLVYTEYIIPYDDKHVRDDPLKWVGGGVHVLNIHFGKQKL